MILVTLRARSAHRSALGHVQHLKENARVIRCARHHSTERINLAHHLSLGKSTDRRVATHGANLAWIHRH